MWTIKVHSIPAGGESSRFTPHAHARVQLFSDSYDVEVYKDFFTIWMTCFKNFALPDTSIDSLRSVHVSEVSERRGNEKMPEAEHVYPLCHSNYQQLSCTSST